MRQKKYDFLFILCIIEIIIFAGERRIILEMIGMQLSILIFLLTCFIYYYDKKKKVSIPFPNNKKIFFIFFWNILTTYVLSEGSCDLTIVSYTLIPLGVCYFVSVADFYRFRELLLKLFSLLSLLAIIVQVGHDYGGIFPAQTYQCGEYTAQLSLGIFTTEWGEKRLACIYWEPGQYQIVINYILCLFYDELSSLSKWKKNIKKFGILIIALFMTISTTGYLTFIIILFMILLTGDIVKKYRILFFTNMIFFIVISSIIFSSDVTQNKIEQSEDVNTRSSAQIRMADNLALLMCVMEHPIFGSGLGSEKMNDKLISYGNETSSNAWLVVTASSGIPYLVFILMCIYRNVRYLYDSKFAAAGITLALFISQCGEPNLNFPYIYLYVFTFCSSSKQKKLTK